MLVTKKAPDFTATAVLADGSIVEDFNLMDNLGEKGAVLFFYPLDFTFVCPSEIIAFSHRAEEFKKITAGSIHEWSPRDILLTKNAE